MTMLILISMWFLFGPLLLKSIEYAVNGKKKPKELGGNYEPCENNDEPLACEALIARVFEERLVSAGIMTVAEMTVCEDSGCLDCAPTHQANKPKKELRAIKSVWCVADECEETGVVEWSPRNWLCKAHAEDAYHQRQKNRTPVGYKRGGEVITIMDQQIPWPNNVPRHAEVTYSAKAGNGAWPQLEVVWSWYENGKVVLMRQIVMMRQEFEAAVYSDQSSKPVLVLPTLGKEEREKRSKRREEAYRAMEARAEKALDEHDDLW